MVKDIDIEILINLVKRLSCIDKKWVLIYFLNLFIFN